MNELSLFTGAGGGLLGTMLLGFHPIGYVEWDDYCQRVIAARIRDGILPDAPIFGDIKTFIRDGYAASYQGMVDVITGGFPCQDISVAGAGKGISGGARSGLWGAMAEVVRIVGPRYVLVENSPMLTIRGLGTILRDFSRMGYVGRWATLGSFSTGQCVNRKRMWIVATRADSLGFFRPKIQIEKPSQVASSKRQFERASGATVSEEDHALMYGNPDGLARGMERLKAIGNGQNPKLVAAAWRILTCT